jgi:hypothetical protein
MPSSFSSEVCILRVTKDGKMVPREERIVKILRGHIAYEVDVRSTTSSQPPPTRLMIDLAVTLGCRLGAAVSRECGNDRTARGRDLPSAGGRGTWKAW